MTLLELNKLIDGKWAKDVEARKSVIKTATPEQFKTFRKYLAINDAYRDLITKTDSSTEFFESCPLLLSAVDEDVAEDLFYAMKLGFMYNDVPSRLVYYLQKAMRMAESPNLAISMLSGSEMKKYLRPGAIASDITVKQILTNLFGCEFKLLTTATRKVRFNDWYEVYVNNTDRVVLLPEDIAEAVDSREDLKNVNFKENVGVCVYDMPLRTFGNRLGITTDDYDLRGCI